MSSVPAPASTDHRQQRVALVQNLVAILTWSLAPSMVRAVTGSFPVNFQNACRYITALLVLWPVYLLSARRDRPKMRSDLRQLLSRAPRILVIALAAYGFQVCYTYSLFLITPSLQALVGQVQVIFAVLFAVLLFPDERAFIRGWRFLAGVTAALGGVALVIVGGRAFGTVEFGVGVLVVVASNLCWALLGSLLRAWVPDLPAQMTVSAVFTVVSPAFVVTYAIAHHGLPIPAAPLTHWLLLVSSGLVAIGLGHSMFYRAVPVLGVSVSTSLGLLLPLLVSLVSFVALGETLTSLQLVGGVILLAGSFLVIRARFRGGPARAPGAVPGARAANRAP
ncbi:MAG TPA: DMT family transporter [Spirochaetia bacterium]|nr:DMT family transporter [Spirochaetia bacterium]